MKKFVKLLAVVAMVGGLIAVQASAVPAGSAMAGCGGCKVEKTEDCPKKEKAECPKEKEAEGGHCGKQKQQCPAAKAG
jgi:hypothetical protein